MWPLLPYMTSATQLGSNLNDSSLTAALTLVNQLVNLQQAVSPGVGVPAGWAVQTAKLYTIANDFHTCVLSAGGEAGDGSACGQLFSLATPPGVVAPKNIIEAAFAWRKPISSALRDCSNWYLPMQFTSPFSLHLPPTGISR